MVKFVDKRYGTLFVCFSIVVLSLSCGVRYVANYNATLSNDVIAVAKRVDSFYAHLIDAPDSLRTFDKYREEYTSIEVDLNSIVMRNQIRPLNKESTQIAKNALGLWLKFRAEHKKKNEYKDAMAELDRQHMARIFVSMFNAEEAKKTAQNGDK
jgi:hypothetical protein